MCLSFQRVLDWFAQVAEWQTRWTQNPLPAMAWGFESLFGHKEDIKKQLKSCFFYVFNQLFFIQRHLVQSWF